MNSFQIWLPVQARVTLRPFTCWDLGWPGFLYSLERKVYVTHLTQQHHTHDNLSVCMLLHTTSDASYHMVAKQERKNTYTVYGTICMFLPTSPTAARQVWYEETRAKALLLSRQEMKCLLLPLSPFLWYCRTRSCLCCGVWQDWRRSSNGYDPGRIPSVQSLTLQAFLWSTAQQPWHCSTAWIGETC